MKRVAIVLVNWNGGKDTLLCLDSLSKLNTTNLGVSTIVVDNASTDDSIADIKRRYPKIEFIKNTTNLGFTGGNNRGIDLALQKGADYVWLLNNDTTVAPQALQALVNCCTNNQEIGIVGSKIYFTKGREYHKTRYKTEDIGKVIWYAGGQIDWANMYGEHRGVDEVDVGQYDRVEETDFVTGCAMFVSRAVFEQVGHLDEKFFAYYEDLDFCLRAKKFGFKLYFAPTSVVWHKNAGSSGGSGSRLHEYYLTRNRLLVGMRYAPFRTKLALIKEGLLMLIGKNPRKSQAVVDFFLGRFGKRYAGK